LVDLLPYPSIVLVISQGGDIKLFGLLNKIWNIIILKIHQEEQLNASLVSRKLRELALDPALMKKLDLRDFIVFIQDLEGCQEHDSSILHKCSFNFVMNAPFHAINYIFRIA
jgi:hypothetical protein